MMFHIKDVSMAYTINCNNSVGLTQEKFVPLKIDSSPWNCLGKRIFGVLPKVNLVIFFGFDFLPKLVLVNSTPLLILHRRYDSICIRHKSTSPLRPPETQVSGRARKTERKPAPEQSGAENSATLWQQSSKTRT